MFSLVAQDIYKFNSQFFYGEPVGTYLINLYSKIILFDLPTYSESLKIELQDFAKDKEIVAVLSHGSCGIADGTKWQKEMGLRVYLHKSDEHHDWLRMNPDFLFESLNIDDSVEVIHTPAHSDGSVCLLHKPSKTLFTGDSIYSRNGKNLILDNNIEMRSQALSQLLSYDFENIMPFHYLPLMGNAKEELEKF
jgi:hypothetical protein